MRSTRIVGLTLAGLLAFLAWMLGYDLFMLVPWKVRWWLGMATFLGVVVALVGGAYRRFPPRPWALIDPAQTADRGTHRVIAWGLQAVTLSFAYAFFYRPGYGGVSDWDLHQAWFEAFRQSLLRYGQFPWWDPWCAGGFPLAFEPQMGLVSLDTLFVLPMGADAGLRLATIASMMLAVEGARRLARHLFADPWAVALVAAVYAWNGAIIILTVNCHALTICYPFIPWILLYTLRIDRGPVPAALLGVASAASVLTVIQYPTAYAALICAAALLWGFLAQPRPARPRYVALVGLAAGVFLTLAGWRVVLTGLILRDFPRHGSSWINSTPWTLARDLLDRYVPPARVYPYLKGFEPEYASYVGVIPLAAAALSLGRGWRWWHTLAAVCYAMAIGSVQVYHPSYWVSTWPGFATMHNVGRWKIPGLLGLALAAGSEAQAWRAGDRRRRLLGALLVAVVLADLAVYAHQCLPATFSTPPEERHVPGPPVPGIVNIQKWEFRADTEGYEAVRRGYGVIQGYCPSLDYDRGRKTLRLWRGHPAYVGEYTSEGRPIVPEFWSPQLITFQLRPGQVVEINQNPGNYWRVNGSPVFAGWKCAELLRPFVARADDRGRLRLEIQPPGVPLAIGTSAFGLLLAAACYRLSGRLGVGESTRERGS